MSTRPTTPRRARIRTSAPAAHAMVTADPSGLWIVTGHGKRARYAQRNGVVVERTFPTPFGRRTRRPHAPQAPIVCTTFEHDITSRISKIRCDTDGRELTDERRYAPTSVPLRLNRCSRPPESLFHFTGIRRRGGAARLPPIPIPLRPLPGDRRGRPCGKLLSASRKAGRSSTEARATPRAAGVGFAVAAAVRPCHTPPPPPLWAGLSHPAAAGRIL